MLGLSTFSGGILATNPFSPTLPDAAFWTLVVIGALILVWLSLGMRYIPNNMVGVVEKLWSARGSVGGGRIIATHGEAGYQSDLLRGGIHFFLWRIQYRIHRAPLVMIGQGKIGYVYARDGEGLLPSQTLGRFIECNKFQDARAFIGDGQNAATVGQRGRQRIILREGMYAINLALFVVVTEDTVYRLDLQGRQEFQAILGPV